MSLFRPRIFEYDNYRKFLKDTYEANKKLDKKFSFRFFARNAGYKSPSILLDIMSGKKNLSSKGIERFSKALRLSPQETTFFKNLVNFTQAANTEERVKFAADLARSKIFKETYPLAESQFRYFKFWYLTAIKEMVGLPNFKEDPEWIAKKLVPAISSSEAKQALSDLIKLGLIRYNEQNKLVQTDSLVSTPNEVSSAYVTNWHREYLKKASESIDIVPRDLRDITAAYFSFTEKNLIALKELIRKFRKDVLNLSTHQEDKDSVYQLNIQLFPVARINREGS